MNKNTKMAAVVVNDLGDILPYTVQGTISLCEEKAIEFFGQSTWEKLVSLGAKVVQCEIVLLNQNKDNASE